MKKCGMRDSCEKGAGMRDQDPPFQTLKHNILLSVYKKFFKVVTLIT